MILHVSEREGRREDTSARIGHDVLHTQLAISKAASVHCLLALYNKPYVDPWTAPGARAWPVEGVEARGGWGRGVRV